MEHCVGQQQEGKSEEEIRLMPLEEVQAWAVQLQATLQAREVQLERKFEEVANMHDVTQQLMVCAYIFDNNPAKFAV